MSKTSELFKIMDFMKKYEIKKYFINDDLTVDVDESVFIRDKKMKKLPIKFGRVDGLFDITGCESLVSLDGCPEYVSGTFYAMHCDSLKNLIGGPKRVGDSYYCRFCKNLESLDGLAEHIGYMVFYDGCPKLEGLPYDWYQ